MTARDLGDPTHPADRVREDDVPSAGSRRPLRADAARNRALVLRAATEVFSRQGADARLEEVASAAEVGTGTLYRHFPTRCDLVLAAYSTQVEAVERGVS